MTGAAVIEAARRYIVERGFRVVPLGYRRKDIQIKGWQTLRLDEDDLPRHFNGRQQNIGILTGEPSGGLVDIDLDIRQARELASAFLPPTTLVSGRASAPHSHRWYRADPLPETAKFRDPTVPEDDQRSMLVEFRSTRCQTLAPPSVHPSGEAIIWHESGEPAVVDGPALLAQVRKLAAAALLARRWPPQGTRHDAALALAGGLVRAGWSEDDAADFILAVAGAAGDEEARERPEGVRTSIRRLTGGQKATGWPTLAKLVGDSVVDRVCEWLGVRGVSVVSGVFGQPSPDGDEPDRTPIVVNGRYMRDITRDGVAALERANGGDPTLFVRGGALVRAVHAEDGLAVGPLRHAALKGLLDRAANFVKVSDGKAVPARPPDDVVEDILVSHSLPLPRLREVARAPLLLPDGRLLAADGYDAESGVLLELRGLDGVRGDLPLSEAAALLRDELLVDFPFADEASLAHAVGMFAQPFARLLVDGPTPLYLVEAPAQGTGKGLLADLVGVVAEGRGPAVMGLSRDEDEVDKRIAALLLGSARILLFDNITGITSAKVSAALTATTYSGRLLGRSEMLTLPNTALWLATGNNVELSKEMGRRVVPIRLDAEMERPEERTGFKHALPPWAYEHRPELVSACVSLIRAWLDAGRPAPERTLGRFESWVRVIGGIVTHAGFPGFLTNRTERVAAADRESGEWAAFASAWWKVHQDRPVAAGKLLDLAVERHLLLDIYAGRSKLSAAQRMGHALASHRDSVVHRWAIRSSGRDADTSSAAYRLEQREPGVGRHRTTETTETKETVNETARGSPGFGHETTAETAETKGNHGETTDHSANDSLVSVVSVVSGQPSSGSAGADTEPADAGAETAAGCARDWDVRRRIDELRTIVAELGWPELIVLGQHVGPGEERWRKFCDYPPPWLPAALEVAKEQRRLAADLPF
jgi:hypothetical protein